MHEISVKRHTRYAVTLYGCR